MAHYQRIDSDAMTVLFRKWLTLNSHDLIEKVMASLELRNF
jgi:hypothetical protein